MRLQNDLLDIDIKTFGAELASVKCKQSNYEYIWQADPEVWGRHAPNLFPIVGRLQQDTYKIGDTSYKLGQHGFARDNEFDVVKWNPNELEFQLKSSPDTWASYPFDFQFRIAYALEGNALTITYKVKNTGNDPMPFSFGAHPAFNTSPIDGHRLRFEKEEEENSDTVVQGIRTGQLRSVFQKDSIQLNNEIFDADALIFNKLKSTNIVLENSEANKIVGIDFPGFPFLGIWAKPKANFVCIEPWCGIADKLDHNQDIFLKEGIRVAQPDQEMQESMVITFYPQG